MIDRIVVETKAEDGRGRSFEAALLGYITADVFTGGGGRDTDRPVWAAYAGTDEAIRPFTANARTGRKILVPKGNQGTLSEGAAIEFLRSAGHHFALQRLPDGLSVVTAYQPEFFRLDPGMVDPESITFLMAPSIPWIEAHAQKFAEAQKDAIVDHVVQVLGTPTPKGKGKGKGHEVFAAIPSPKVLRSLIPLASMFAGYLDRRTRAPLIPDPRFQLQLMVQCLAQGAAYFAADKKHYDRYSDAGAWGEAAPSKLFGHNLPQAGLWCAMGFSAKHESFQDLLSEEVARFFKHAA